MLREGGTFVAKIFRGRGAGGLCAQLQTFFDDVAVAKPKCSRNSSPEAFVVCRGFRTPSHVQPGVLRPLAADAWATPADGGAGGEATTPRPVAFVACGDLTGYDADANYDLPAASGAYTPIEPTQPPTTPAYRAFLEEQHARHGRRTVLDGGREWVP